LLVTILSPKPPQATKTPINAISPDNTFDLASGNVSDTHRQPNTAASATPAKQTASMKCSNGVRRSTLIWFEPYRINGFIDPRLFIVRTKKSLFSAKPDLDI
jgi:hypothetical protein